MRSGQVPNWVKKRPQKSMNALDFRLLCATSLPTWFKLDIKLRQYKKA